MEIIKYWKLPAFLAGIVLFWYVLESFGFSEFFKTFHYFGFAALSAFLFYPIMTLWDVASWRLLFQPEHSKKVHFYELFLIRLAGEAVNNITPFLDIGGEPIKARLLAKRFKLAMDEAVSSTVIAKTSLLISEALFMFMGAALSFIYLDLSLKFRVQLSLFLLVICFVFTGFLYLQQKGAFEKMNTRIRQFYSTQAASFWSAAGLNWMGWIFGGLETYFFCRLAGMDISILEAVMLEALLQLVRTGSFFIPMNLGVQEGGMAIFSGILGFEPAAGVGISLLKRFRQILWTAVGFVVLGVYQYIESGKNNRFRAAGANFLDSSLDRLIHRPPADFLALMISKTAISPNQVTLCSLLPAILSAAFFSIGSLPFVLIGLLFFYVWALIDHTDGSLARQKGRVTAFGQKLDDVCDIVCSSVILYGLFTGFLGLWGYKDQAILLKIFYPALFINIISSHLLLTIKRKTQKNMLNLISGRGGFYLLILSVIVSRAFGDLSWHLNSFVMGFFIISLWTASLLALVTYFNFKRLEIKQPEKREKH